MGVQGGTYVHPYARTISQGCKVFLGHVIEAMRAPRARPSKVSIAWVSHVVNWEDSKEAR